MVFHLGAGTSTLSQSLLEWYGSFSFLACCALHLFVVSVCLNFQATIVILVIQNWVTLLLPFSVSRSSCWGTILSECHACRFQVEVHIGMCFLHIKNFISLLLRGYAISRHPWNLLFPSWDHSSTYEILICQIISKLDKQNSLNR